MSLATLASYTLGQCTYGMASINSWVPSGWGNAAQWFGNAQAHGYPTSPTPVVGSIIAWGPNAGPADSSAGHVAQVVGINPNGAPTIREMNGGKGVGVWDTRTISASEASAAQGYILPKGGLAGAQSGGTWAGNVTSSTANPAAASGPTSDCMSISEMMQASNPVESVVSKIPLIGGAVTGLAAPVVMVRWITQPCVYKRLLIQFGCVLLIWQGMKFAGAPGPSPINVVSDVGKTGARAAAA